MSILENYNIHKAVCSMHSKKSHRLRRSLEKIVRFITLSALIVGVAGCAYEGDGLDNPFMRRFTWFSFAAGDDIRQSCQEGGQDRLRAIYNGFWMDQVRVYELGDGADPYVLRQRVLEGVSVRLWTTRDVMAPFRGATAERTLSAEQHEKLVGEFIRSGLKEPPPVGLRLNSDGFYWTVVGCLNGQFVFNAWLYPRADFMALTFPEALMALDQTGVPFNHPSPNNVTRFTNRELFESRWTLVVRENGF